MTLQRLDFKNFGDAPIQGVSASGQKIFLPNGSREKAHAPPPPPIFSEEDMKTAERDGYKKGFLEGVADGRKQAESEQADVDRKLVALLDGFTEKLSPIFDDYRKTALQLREDMPKMAVAIAKKVAGHALDQHAEAVVSDVAIHACETMMQEAKLTFTIHESLADTLAGKLKELAGRMPAAAQLIILRSPDIPISDCNIEWEHGSMERSTQHIWQQIEKAIDNIIATSVRDSKQQLDVLSDTVHNPTGTKE